MHDRAAMVGAGHVVVERSNRQSRRHLIRQRVTDDAREADVVDGAYGKLALVGPVFGDVGEPHQVGLVATKWCLTRSSCTGGSALRPRSRKRSLSVAAIALADVQHARPHHRTLEGTLSIQSNSATEPIRIGAKLCTQRKSVM
jgi:hypothetical protein